MKERGGNGIKSPYTCLVGEHEFTQGRIPDEFSFSVSGTYKDTKLKIVEVYYETEEEFHKNKKQREDDSEDFDSFKVEYDKDHTIITLTLSGSRKEITEAIFREISIHAKFFLGDFANLIFDDIIVEAKN